MSIGARRELANQAGRMTVCVDRLDCGEIYGRVLHPVLASPFEYAGVMDLACRMEALFNRMAYPQSSFSARMFCEREPRDDGAYSREVFDQMSEVRQCETQSGEKATFIVEVKFRQNATWQGTITWVERKKSQWFRSVLELIKLMNDALGADPEAFADWKETDRKE